MQTKRLKFPRLFLSTVFILSIAACAPVNPGNPAYSWLNGGWVSVSGPGNLLPGQLIEYVDADFQVINNNQVKGYVSYHSASGRIDEGTITSGVVGKKNNDYFVKGKIYWFGSGITTTFNLDRRANARLTGPLSHSDELPYDRFADLKKAK